MKEGRKEDYMKEEIRSEGTNGVPCWWEGNGRRGRKRERERDFRKRDCSKEGNKIGRKGEGEANEEDIG